MLKDNRDLAFDLKGAAVHNKLRPLGTHWQKPKSQTFSVQITEAILTRIASGHFPPDSTLPSQRELAKDFGVALTVIREAVQRLQVLRVVETRHGSGMVVQRLNWSQIVAEPTLRILALEPEMMNHILEARYGIEKETTQLACRRATAEGIERIKVVLDLASPVPQTFEENMELNRQFHLAIAQAAGNPILVDLLRSFLEVGFTATPEIFNKRAATTVWETHRRLWRAIERRDEAEVSSALAHHMAEGIKQTRIVWAAWNAARPKNANVLERNRKEIRERDPERPLGHPRVR
jgi:GntR family transcriptional repressor for pyruvate dehydrogenase complex